jgi:predicted Zn-dependent protease
MATNSLSARALALTIAACTASATLFGQTVVKLPKNKYTPEQDVKIGREAAEEVRKKYPLIKDERIAAYLTKLGDRLVAASPAELKQPVYEYSFTPVNLKEINAFALPGGPVWVNRGGIQAARTESQLAGILAHEIAHISQRHAAQQLSNVMVTNLGLSLFGALLGNAGGAAAANIAAQYIASGAFLKFSRDDEQEADRVGVGIMRRAGWDPHGMIELMESIREQEKRDPGSVEIFFSNHPSPKERLELLARIVPSRRSGTRDSGAFQSIRARLRAMPPAKAMPKR